jgi:hypothetical protein
VRSKYFYVQTLLSLLISGFCMFQLSTRTVEQAYGYLGLLSSILGYWLPSPVQDEDRMESNQIQRQERDWSD